MPPRQGKPMVVIGSDHAGFELKQALVRQLVRWGYQVDDHGTHSADRMDFPPVAFSVAREVVRQKGKGLGVLICGSGVGVSIAANKVRGARAALATNAYMGRQSREHDQANVLVLAGRVTPLAEAVRIVRAFLTARPDRDPAHRRRVGQIEAYERRFLKSI